ncbi:MAG: O-antigen ligase family protein [Chloroflexota bacterium]|nr:O-antigen ligase family protein [Chloroflexota bacterium]
MIEHGAALSNQFHARQRLSLQRWQTLGVLGMLIVLLVAWFLPPLWALLTFGAVAGTLAVFAHPAVGVGILLFTVPFGSVRTISLPENVDITVNEPLVALIGLSWLAGMLAGRWSAPSLPSLTIPIVIVMIPMGLSALAAESLLLSIKEISKWAELFVIYLVTATTVRSRRVLAALVGVLLLAALAEVGIGLLQVAFRIGPPHFLAGGILMRAHGTFGQPNPYGGYLALILPIALAIALSAPRHHIRLLGWGVSIALALGIVVSLSRGAWLGTLAALSVVWLLESQRNRPGTIVLAYCGFTATLIVLILGVIPEAILSRVTDLFVYGSRLAQELRAGPNADNWAILERVSQWYAGWQMFAENPYLGVGIGNYPKAYEVYALPGWPTGVGHAHNYYLNLAAEGGVLTLTAFLLFLGLAWYLSIRAWRRAPDIWGRLLALGLMGSLAAFSAHSLVDSLFVHSIGILLGILFGLLSALGSSAQQRDTPLAASLTQDRRSS